MTQPDSQSPTAGSQSQGGAAQVQGQVDKTPNSDMQAEDTGTEESGVEAVQGTAAEAAMKQTSKTDAETGS